MNAAQASRGVLRSVAVVLVLNNLINLLVFGLAPSLREGFGWILRPMEQILSLLMAGIIWIYCDELASGIATRFDSPIAKGLRLGSFVFFCEFFPRASASSLQRVVYGRESDTDKIFRFFYFGSTNALALSIIVSCSVAVFFLAPWIGRAITMRDRVLELRKDIANE